MVISFPAAAMLFKLILSWDEDEDLKGMGESNELVVGAIIFDKSGGRLNNIEPQENQGGSKISTSLYLNL